MAEEVEMSRFLFFRRPSSNSNDSINETPECFGSIYHSTSSVDSVRHPLRITPTAQVLPSHACFAQVLSPAGFLR